MFDKKIDEETVFFEISGNGNFVKINLIGFSHPNAELDWDKNWVKVFVEVKAGAFSGEFDADLMTTDFASFRNELEELYSKLTGTATFSTLEDQVNIKVIGDGIGHLKAECYVMDSPGLGSILQFEIDFDQTYIPNVIRQIEKIINRFPKIGQLN
ncbi:MAG: WapI family immunity protein [Pedobacter sp.]